MNSEIIKKSFLEHFYNKQSDAILKNADLLCNKPIKTITSAVCQRSGGGKNDFYSEGDYWWPDPNNPNGPYVKKDGQSNPDNFIQHRKLLIDFARSVSALTSAYLIFDNQKYAQKAKEHLIAWFIDKNTMMNPHLEYAQAIKGICSGRGIGIIDFVHLVESAICIKLLKHSSSNFPYQALIDWFSKYLTWLNTSSKGQEERNEHNNHGSSWLLQAAAFSSLTDNKTVWDRCCNDLAPKLISLQIDKDGKQFLELNRTKPYCYCNFNLDLITTVCFLITADNNNIWQNSNTQSGSVIKACNFMFPFVKNKKLWMYPQDIDYFDLFPVNHIWLIFAGLHSNNKDFIDLWFELPNPTEHYEVLRNTPINHPLLWIKYMEIQDD